MRTIKILLAIIFVICLAACGSNEPTSAPTSAPTAAPTAAPTEAPTAAPTEAPTAAPTEAPTAPPTEAPTAPPTEPPTVPPTEAPTVPLESVEEPNMSKYHYVLNEVGTFASGEIRSFSSHMPVVRTVVDGVTIDYLYSYAGELKIAHGCLNYDYFGDGRAVMFCADNTTRFVNVNTGDIFLEDPAIANIIELNDRYYYVVFADHGKVYDLDQKCYIDGLTVTDLSLSSVPRAIENTVLVKLGYNQYRVYVNNAPAGEYTNCMPTETGFILETSKGFEVYDHTCNRIATVSAAYSMTNNAAQANTTSWNYFRDGAFQAYTLIDINGKQVIPGTYTGIQLYHDYVILKDSASLYALYLTDGTKLLGHGYTDIIYREDLGVFTLKNLEGTKQVYIPGCGVRDLNELSVSGQFIKDYSYNYMIIATGEAVQLGRSSEMQQASMVDCSQGLMDMYSGTVLLDAGYTFVTVTEEHVYELRDNVWHVYTYDLVAE